MNFILFSKISLYLQEISIHKNEYNNKKYNKKIEKKRKKINKPSAKLWIHIHTYIIVMFIYMSKILPHPHQKTLRMKF